MEDFLFPTLTGLTLVFAGILVGYFLWFRDRSEQMILNEQLATDNERLSAELRSHTSMLTEVEDRESRLSLKNTSLQQLCDDLLKSREKVQLQVNDLETELNSARTKLDRSRDQITEESRTRAKTEETLHQLKQKYIDSVANLEGEWKERFAETSHSLTNHQSEVVRLKVENEQLAGKLHQSNSESARLQSELNAQREILETAKSNAAGLEKEYVSLESSTRAQIELINEARGKAAAALSAQNLAEEALVANRSQVDELKEQILALQSEVVDAEKLESQCEHLELTIAHNVERIESLVQQRDDSLSKQQALEQQLNSLQTRLENQSTSMEQLRAQTDATEQRRQKNHEDLISQIQQLESANHDLIEERKQLQISLESMNSQLSESAGLANQLQLLESTNNDLSAERKQMQNSLESMNSQLSESAGLASQIQQLESANQALMQENTQLSEKLEGSLELRQNNDETFKRVSEENAHLIAKLAEFENVDRNSLISSDEYQTRISSVLEQRDSAYDETRELKAEIKRLRQHGKSNEETIRLLRRERGNILMRNRESNTVQYPRIHNESLDFTRADDLASEYGGTTKLDPVRGNVFVEAPRRKDDLKMIHGVAKVLERKLNGFGIYTFKQVMEWDETAIQEFSELLVFKDRIHRDDWKGQAARFYNQKSQQNDAA